jgi:hypothetical protein
MFNHQTHPSRKAFSSRIRWDRPSFKPKKQDYQFIEVVAQFTSGKIKPLYFNLNNQRYEIERINYFWKDYQGRQKLYCFSVTANGVNNFQIYFNNYTLSWKLAKIE